jgi:hypothetical protein
MLKEKNYSDRIIIQGIEVCESFGKFVKVLTSTQF